MRETIIHVEKWPYRHQPTEAELQQLMLDEALTPYRWANDSWRLLRRP
jgi:hypothetical protein